MRHFATKRALAVVALTACWCGLWATISIANVLSGFALSVVLVASGVGEGGRGSVRLVPVLKLVWVVAVDLVTSTIDVAVEILTPTDRTEEAVIAVPVSVESRDHLLLMSVAITLTPGTAVVDSDPATGTLFLHLLHVDRREATVEHVHRLARLACEAFPSTSGVPR